MPISALSKLGIAKETTWGAGADPVFNLPIEPFNLSFNYEVLTDTSLRGVVAKDFGVYQGVYHVEGDVSGHTYPEELGQLLLTLFGTCADTGTAAPYQHTYTVAQSPPSLAITSYDPVQAVQYRGVYINSFGLKFSAAQGMLDYTAKFMGKSYTTTTATISDATAATPFVGWMATVSAAGSSYAKVIDFDMTLTRDVTLVYTAMNTQAAYTAYVGPMGASGTMTLTYDAVADLNKYVNNTNEIFVVDFTQGTGTGAKEIKTTFSKLAYIDKPAVIQRNNVDLRLVLSWRALHNSTDGGPCSMILKSATASY
jgi:hypothetical protein